MLHNLYNLIEEIALREAAGYFHLDKNFMYQTDIVSKVLERFGTAVRDCNFMGRN